jgi:hypothetical protein
VVSGRALPFGDRQMGVPVYLGAWITCLYRALWSASREMTVPTIPRFNGAPNKPIFINNISVRMWPRRELVVVAAQLCIERRSIAAVVTR